MEQYLDMLFSYGPYWAYVILFLACFIENLLPPFPGDSFIVAAGALVALGRLELALVAPIILGGGMLSVMLLYFLGRNYGRDYVLRKNFRYFSAGDIERMEMRLTRWGGLVLTGSRFVVGFRSALVLAAGIARYPAKKLFVFCLISYILFAGLLMYIAMSFVNNFAKVEELFRSYDQVMLPALGVLLLVYLVKRFRILHPRKKP